MKKTIFVLALSSIVLLFAGCRNGRPANTVLTPDDAAGREIGVLNGTSSYRLADELGTVHVYNESRELADALRSGTLDCVIMENGPAEKFKAFGIKPLSQPLFEQDLSIAIAKENADLLRAVNSALSVLDKDGTLKSLSDKHVLGKSYTYTAPASAGTRDGTLRIAVPGNFPPYSYKNDAGEYIGLDIDVARAVCDIIGVGLTIVETDMNRLVTTVQFGKADLALGCLYKNDDESELVDFSSAYTHFTQVVLVRK